jgi:uncharacterized protein YgbK (DUF1537 family)
MDALENKHLTRAAELIWPGETAPPVFALGSGGLSYGVGDYLHRTEQSSELRSSSIAPVDRVLVVSGSCAPQTAAQIRHAVSSGWRALRLPVGQLINPLSRQATAEDAQAQALSALVAGHSLIVYTALGPDDASLGETRTLMERYELTSEGSRRLSDTRLAGSCSELSRTRACGGCLWPAVIHLGTQCTVLTHTP